MLLSTALTFVAFCLVSSATYMLNDLGDLESDRRHPTKRDRPIPAGIVSVRAALVSVFVLLAAGLGLAYAVNWKLGVLLTGYKLLTTAYTFRLKHTATLDVAVVASGFIVRAVAGGVAADIVLSEWFLAVTSFGSLFLVAGKRHGELLQITDGSTRPALAQYTLAHLQFLVSMTAAVTIVTYCLWAFEHPRTSDVPWWGLSIIPFVIGIMRYALLVDRGEGGAPEELILRDPGMRLVGLAWRCCSSARSTSRGPLKHRDARCGASAAPRATHDAHVPEARITIACGPSHPRLHHIGRTDHSPTTPSSPQLVHAHRRARPLVAQRGVVEREVVLEVVLGARRTARRRSAGPPRARARGSSGSPAARAGGC